MRARQEFFKTIEVIPPDSELWPQIDEVIVRALTGDHPDSTIDLPNAELLPVIGYIQKIREIVIADILNMLSSTGAYEWDTVWNLIQSISDERIATTFEKFIPNIGSLEAYLILTRFNLKSMGIIFGDEYLARTYLTLAEIFMDHTASSNATTELISFAEIIYSVHNLVKVGINLEDRTYTIPSADLLRLVMMLHLDFNITTVEQLNKTVEEPDGFEKLASHYHGYLGSENKDTQPSADMIEAFVAICNHLANGRDNNN